MVAAMLNATNYIIHPRPNIAVDIVAIATFLISEEVVFYFLRRILDNEERESRRKQESPADAGIPARRKNDEKNSSISKL